MAYDVNGLIKLGTLKTLMTKIKDFFATKAALEDVSDRVDEIIETGGEPNTINAIKVNNEVQNINNKEVNISVPTAVSDLNNDEQYQTKDEVAAMVAAAEHMKRKKVASVDAIDKSADDAEQYIYMVPRDSGENGDHYDEYMVIDGNVEKVGNWAVDLSDYVQKDGDKVLSDENYTAADKTKLAGLSNYVHPKQENVTQITSGLFVIKINEEGHITYVRAVEKSDLASIIGNASAESQGLMSGADKEKLDGIKFATDEEVEAMLNEVFATPAA